MEAGDYVVVKMPEHGSEEATFKLLKKIGDQLYLHPLNPKYEDTLLTKKHKLVGKVVMKVVRFP